MVVGSEENIMRKIQKDLLLLGISLLQLKEIHMVKPKDIIDNYDEIRVNQLWDKHFSNGKPSVEDLKSLAMESYRGAIRIKK